MTLGGDIKLFPKPTSTYAVGPADIEVISGESDVVRDPGIQTAVMIAVFTDCRADADDVLPSEVEGRGGWFGEDVLEEKFGSKLWLLYRQNITPEVLSKAKEYIEDALDRHIISQNVADSYEVTVSKDGARVKLKIVLFSLENKPLSYEYYINWQSQTGRV